MFSRWDFEPVNLVYQSVAWLINIQAKKGPTYRSTFHMSLGEIQSHPWRNSIHNTSKVWYGSYVISKCTGMQAHFKGMPFSKCSKCCNLSSPQLGLFCDTVGPSHLAWAPHLVLFWVNWWPSARWCSHPSTWRPLDPTWKPKLHQVWFPQCSGPEGWIKFGRLWESLGSFFLTMPCQFFWQARFRT